MTRSRSVCRRKPPWMPMVGVSVISDCGEEIDDVVIRRVSAVIFGE